MSVEAHEIIPIPMPREESIPEAARRKLSSPWATGLVILITILWTIPTFGLLVTSLRPSAEAQTTGWWTIFTNPTLTLDNYSQVISGGSVIPNGIAPYFFNSFAIAIPAAIFPLVHRVHGGVRASPGSRSGARRSCSSRSSRSRSSRCRCRCCRS